MRSGNRSKDPFEKRSDRRSVQLKAYLVRADKSILDVVVADLAYRGCSIETDTPLVPGEEVLISVLGRGGGRAVVKWYRDRVAGLEFDLGPSEPTSTPRASDRQPVSAEVLLRRQAQKPYRVSVFDVSPEGCRCEFVQRPEIGETVWVKFDGLEALQAEVRWVEGSQTGLGFLGSIHPAVLSMLVERLR